jgi:hypothetical protein
MLDSPWVAKPDCWVDDVQKFAYSRARAHNPPRLKGFERYMENRHDKGLNPLRVSAFQLLDKGLSPLWVEKFA